jgi:hypothetical protein
MRMAGASTAEPAAHADSISPSSCVVSRAQPARRLARPAFWPGSHEGRCEGRIAKHRLPHVEHRLRKGHNRPVVMLQDSVGWIPFVVLAAAVVWVLRHVIPKVHCPHCRSAAWIVMGDMKQCSTCGRLFV